MLVHPLEIGDLIDEENSRRRRQRPFLESIFISANILEGSSDAMAKPVGGWQKPAANQQTSKPANQQTSKPANQQ
ncbi:MAG: hypothetical protein RQ741_07255, partial [Wenzhouxiangellaceae bacterium]|nr:hypothetical protein [Wenzhouxiangellaceae bacterium]